MTHMQKTISGNAKIVRDINRSMILNIIRKNQPISRARIAKMTGLNKSTVSSIVADLINEELIYEQINQDRNIGRNPIDLSIKLGRSLIGAINIDSAVTCIAIVDIDGTILAESKFDTKPKDPKSFVSLCVRKLKALCKRSKIEKLEGLGISVAGIVDSRVLRVDFAPNLGWENFNIGEEFIKHMPDLKIIAVGNDAKASALAELWFGDQGADLSNFVFLSVGDGIGAGIVVEGKLLQGEFQAAGEVGHLILIEGGEQCVCGNYGCWERYASDTATVKRYCSKIKNKASDENCTLDYILKKAEQGDEIATDVLNETGDFLGLGIATIVKAYDPHAIVIGGRITSAWDIIHPRILEEVEKRAFYGRHKNIIIIPTSLKIRPRLLGAATLAIKEIFDDYKIMI